MLRSVLTVAAAAIVGFCAFAEDAQAGYPDRPIKLVVPFAPGSATDLLGRIIAQGLSEKLGQPVVVEPKPGAGTSIGAQAVERSPADGYTLLLGTNATFALNTILYRQLPYDPAAFKFIATTGGMPSFLIVSATSKYKTLGDFVKAAKEKPGSLTYASSGVGSTGDMVGKLLGNAAGVNLVHVPYKDGPQGLTAAMTGEVDGIFYTSIAAMPLISAGKVRPLAVSTDKRTTELPNVPTVAESGYPGFNLTGWTVLAVPLQTPQAVVDKLREAMLSLYKNSAYQAKVESLGLQTQKLAGKDLDSFVASEQARMKDVAKRANITPE